jgi:hypothetical protein
MVENREATMEGLAAMMGVGYGSVVRIIHAVGANKVTSVWVPHELTEDQRVLHANIALDQYQSCTDDNSILDRIIAIDETWLKSYDPHDDYASRQWVLLNEDAQLQKVDCYNVSD